MTSDDSSDDDDDEDDDESDDDAGMATTPLDSISKQIGRAIGTRLKARSNLDVCQSSALTLDNIPLSALRAILPPETSERVWDYNDASDVQMLGDLLSRWNPKMQGVTKALQAASESVIRVVATLMVIKLTSVAGVDTLKIEMMYVLADGYGMVHWPKDEARRMIGVSQSQESDIRAQLFADVRRMSANPDKFWLSPEWRNQVRAPPSPPSAPPSPPSAPSAPSAPSYETSALGAGVLWIGGTSGLALTFFEEELGPLPYP